MGAPISQASTFICFSGGTLVHGVPDLRSEDRQCAQMFVTTLRCFCLPRFGRLALSKSPVFGTPKNAVFPVQSEARGVHAAASPKVARMDEPVSIRVRNLDPEQPITMATKLEEDGDIYVSHGFYVADGKGSVDLNTSACLGGSYTGCEPMGLFWSMLPQAGSKPGLRLRKRDVTQPHHVTLSVLPGHVTADRSSFHEPSSALAQLQLERYYAWADVIRVPVREGRIRGTLFVPKNGTGRHTGVLDIYGSTGGLAEYRAAMLASRGFTTLALGWALYDDLPPSTQVSYDYFLEALDFLHQQPTVRPGHMGIIGISMGGCIALALATMDARVRAVVSISSLGIRPMSPHHYKGEEIPYAPFDLSLLETVREGLVSWKKMMINITEVEGQEQFAIEVGKARHTDFLFLHGADDQNVDARLMLRTATQMLDHGHNGVSLHVYQGAGHLLEPPYIPFCYDSWHKLLGSSCLWGGEARRHSHAQVQAWRLILDFFRDRLP